MENKMVRKIKCGFTLVELMVVMVIITILAAISIPQLTGFILEGHLDEAKPYLMQIAAKMKIRYNRLGPTAASTTSTFTTESNIASNLGVNLQNVGDFCFITLDNSDSASFRYNVAPTEDDFEVWAILRSTNDVSVDSTTTPSVTCNTWDSTTKGDPTGWVESSGIGSGGRVVVLHEPPPPNGPGPNAIEDWQNGVSSISVLR